VGLREVLTCKPSTLAGLGEVLLGCTRIGDYTASRDCQNKVKNAWSFQL
jgi:hypothetical protein